MATPRARSGKPVKRPKALIRSASVDRKRPGSKPGSKAGSRRNSSGRKVPLKSLLPALTVLILVGVALAGLLHWGATGPPEKAEPQPVKHARSPAPALKDSPVRQKETGSGDRESRSATQVPEASPHAPQGRPIEKPKIEPPTAPPPPVSSPVRSSNPSVPLPPSPAQPVTPPPLKPHTEVRPAQPKEPPREPLPVQMQERVVPQPANLQPSPPRALPVQEVQERKARRDDPVENPPVLTMNIPPKLPEAPAPPVGAPVAPAKSDARPSGPSARVAIIIDDLGQDLKMAEKFVSLPVPVTFSILPFQRHSRQVAEIAHQHKREVILHLPMEPQGYPQANPGRGALLLSMSGEEVLKSLQTAVDSTPYIQGANNHMGSRFTENPEMMRIVLAELQRRNLYFLDSFTTPRSAGTVLAKEINLPHVQRDIFLDHVVTESAIRSQVDQLIERAKLEGTAIAIGHPHVATHRVLLQSMERFRQEGINVVTLGSLATR